MSSSVSQIVGMGSVFIVQDAYLHVNQVVIQMDFFVGPAKQDVLSVQVVLVVIVHVHWALMNLVEIV